MSVYEAAVADGTIATISGLGGPRNTNPLSTEQAAWLTYAAVVGLGAVAGAVAAGREGAVAGALAGVAGVALFGDIQWSG